MTDKPLLGRHDAVPRRRWRWLLPTVIVLAAVALGASLIARAGQEDPNSPKAILDTYLSALESQDTDRAYGMLCSKNKPTLAEFERGATKERQNFGGVMRHRMGTSRRLEDGTVGVSYTVQYRQTYRWYEARMTRAGGEWRVCGFKEIPRPEVRLPANQIPEAPGFVDTGTTTTTR